ncbi:MAG: hypothetical protein ACI3ZT_01030 [Candidatus Cryptobacteroides sp.]
MKRIFLILLFIASVIPAMAQKDFDIYVPKEYAPLHYRPYTTFRFTPEPYREANVIATVQKLKEFLIKTKAYPELYTEYKGDRNDYVTIAAKYLAKGKAFEYEYIGDKKQMKYFQEDWLFLDRYIYDEKMMANKQAAEKSINDSIAFRTKFVSDSLAARQTFVKDSLAARTEFVEDSLYRANYRKIHHYDHVVFDGPHGEPLLCYRRGKIIDGKIFNEYGLVSKVYKDGELIHDYEYSNEYLHSINVIGDSYPTGGFDDGVQIHDKVRRMRTFYYFFYPERINYILYYNADGLDEKKIVYDNNGDIKYEIEYLSYYPDDKTVKTETVTYYKESDISYNGNYKIIDFFSDGSKKKAILFRKLKSGELIIKEIWTYRNGFADVEYYDFNGNLERQSTEILRSSWFF